MTAQFETLLQHALGADYQLERELEAGGMSRLFIAKDARLNRQVVIKVLPPDLVSTTSVARFKREIELTVRLQHPHILPILTSGEWEDGFYYVTPFIAGESLRDRLARDGKLPLGEAVKILRDVSGALAFAHQRGIVHRDIKPGNILLADGHAILADFGIARAVSTTATPLTESGVAPGTPAYMAPELPSDERADVYALGIVGYEMLCGHLPQLRVTGAAILETRGHVAGEKRAHVKRVAKIIASVLDSAPDRRVVTAKEVAALLSDERLGAPSRLHWIAISVVGTMAIGAVSALGIRAVLVSRRPLDASQYFVLSTTLQDSIVRRSVRDLVEAIDEWQGVRAIDPEIGESTISRRAGYVAVDDLLRAARALGARYVVVVDAGYDRDSVALRGTLYDVSNDSSLKTRRVAYQDSSNGRSRQIESRRLANALLRDGSDLPDFGVDDAAPPSISAWRAYDRGRSAIAAWDLEGAERYFREALAAEPSLTQAELWLAQALAWRTVPDADAEIRRATRHILNSPLLDVRDSIRAGALLALASGDFQESCRQFSRLVSFDSSSLAAWIGIGDCKARDHAVVRDRRTWTGWGFRSSYEDAARAYRRASDQAGVTAPSALRGWLLGRLSKVLYGVPNELRLGRPLNGDTITFVALPYLDQDTLAFAPYFLSDASSGREDPNPERVQAAVARNRDVIRRAAEEWVVRDPRDPNAFDSLAVWAELSGGVAMVGEEQHSTIEILDRARELGTDQRQLTRLAISAVRIRLKSGDFAGARFEADSLLKSGASLYPDMPGVAGVAALVGRVGLTRRLAARSHVDNQLHLPNGQIATLPPQLIDSWVGLITYASFDGPVDSIDSYASQAVSLIASYFPDERTAALVRSGNMFSVPLTLAYPHASRFLIGVTLPPDEVTRAYRMIVIGDSGHIREQLALIRRIGRGKVPGTSVDGNLRRARLALVLGDTTAAIDELDPVLRALPTLSPSVTSQVSQIVALVRAMALRAEIAQNRGDSQTSRRYASAVVTLWSGADAALQGVVQRMRFMSR